jgi:P27 family predicted phage terminase small subunit
VIPGPFLSPRFWNFFWGGTIVKGRKPVPTHLKLLRGNPGKRPLPENQPTPEPGAAMPDYLSPGAASHWPAVASELDAAGVLTRLDQTALALYCETFVRWRHATDHVAQHGPVIVSPSGLERLSPYLVIADRASEQMLKLLTEFGMTPSSRSRVSKVMPDKPQMNPRAALLTRAWYLKDRGS